MFEVISPKTYLKALIRRAGGKSAFCKTYNANPKLVERALNLDEIQPTTKAYKFLAKTFEENFARDRCRP